MATSNFYYYDDLLNLYSITYDEALYNANAYCEYHNIDKDDDLECEKAFNEANKGLRIFDESEMEELENFIEELNKKIKDKAYRLYDSNRQCDQDEYYNLIDCKIYIESGYYEGFQIAVSKDYQYLNKTNQKMIQQMFKKIARKFGMYAYTLAYRFSNGETGFHKVKEYKYEFDKVRV